MLKLVLCLLAFLAFAAPAKFGTPHAPRRLISFDGGLGDNTTWLTESEIEMLPLMQVAFMDVTDNPIIERPMKKMDPIPSDITFPEQDKLYISKMSLSRMTKTIGEEGLGQFWNRYYTTEHGGNSAAWLYKQYEDIIKASGRTDLEVKYHVWREGVPQQNIIASIKGKHPTKADQIVIFGGHQDCTAGGASRPCPGADDDASGSATVLEVFNVLVTEGFVPERTIEFHAYAAEEAGLLGSAVMAREYAQAGREVYAMHQADMTGYGTNIIIATRYTDGPLTTFLQKLADEFCDWPTRAAPAPANSDHASWNRQGYRASYGPESPVNPGIHSIRDTLANIVQKRVQEYANMAMAFCVELSLAV